MLRQLLRVAWDCLSWVLATFVVVGSRYDFTLKDSQDLAVLQYALVACLTQVIVGTLLMLYRGRYKTASFDESFGLAISTVIVSCVLAVIFLGLVGTGVFPRAVAVLTPPVALLLMAAGRWGYRVIVTKAGARGDADAERTLIYGAGNAGHQLVRLLTMEATAPFRPVGLIDDDRSKRRLRLMGVPVLGDRSRLLQVAAEVDATTVILAISNAGPELVRQISAVVEGAGLRFLVLPPVNEMVGGRVKLSDIREVDMEDLLGRRQIHTEVAGIAGYLTNRVVLITGAGGSIGSELARQVHKFGPKELVLLDRDESALHAVQLSIYGQGLLDTPDMVLADIRDAQVIDEIFALHRPEVIFHAAALKHLPMLEQYPEEGWKTNVQGTLNVLEAARKVGCVRFVNVSTDKAADPTCTLGRTKRVAERLTSWFSANTDGTYISVRFGNVLGSRGSVLHAFMEQIQRGGPVTVTHPDITRYFMTVPEACQLVIQAGAIGEGGEVLIFDMGEPVRILDVARRLVTRSGQEIEIIFT
ncbi:MAG TPA: nucleoside-diphosphate sugar epimerase/dehydratase, partial [Microlunatus sp.]|nr:nucleoside-diphosphate sugar epimerase/dehydratase [Microlunatus sp.]